METGCHSSFFWTAKGWAIRRSHRSNVSTAVSRRIGATDAVLLVYSATQPMQASPLAAIHEVVATGSACKLNIAFTHFDEVKGDYLPDASWRRRITF